LVFFILTTGGILILTLTYYHEKPMKRLLAYSREQVPDLPEELDGLEAFQFALKSLEERADDNVRKQEQNYLLLKLIYGQECEAESLRRNLTDAGLFINAEYYRAIVLVSLDDVELNHNKIEIYLNTMENQVFEFRLIDLSSDNAAVMIVGMKEESEKQLKEELLFMADALADSMEGTLRFFVGEKCVDYSQIHFSYSQAYACAHRQDVAECSREKVVFYHKTRKGRKIYQYPKKELSDLYDALIETDIEKISDLTDELLRILETQRTDRFASVALYYDILNSYYRALIKLKKDKELDLSETDILMVSENEDAIRMINHIREQYERYVVGQRENKADVNDKKEPEDIERFIGRVSAYIDENIQSGDLNVGSVADTFGLSISQMSHKFKDQTGKNISDYITEKKFAYACQLLKDTELSVKEITVITGYSHPYSFGRKFKQLYGMTPGEYRERKG